MLLNFSLHLAVVVYLFFVMLLLSDYSVIIDMSL